MTLERLTWQLDRLVEQGVHNMVVLNLAPTGPTYGSLADQPRLFSDEWWSLWEGLCEHARERGARLWFYDQIGFSGANLQGQLVTEHPEFMGWSLERALVEDSAGGTTGSAREIPTLRRGFDYLSREACAALLDVVHGEFERRLGRYLGNVITGSFQDELPSLPTWSEHFPAEFEKRKGYRIEPVLSALWDEGDERAAQVRLDYQQVRAELAEEAFFRPLHEWHERHGMIVGVDQQSPSRAGEPIGCVRQYADYPRTHRWFSAPGSDHHGEARIHSSLAHHYGRPRTWIESFHSSGWGGTLEETFDWLVPWLLAGATLYDPHAVYYSTRGGWWEWAPPSTCWRQPYWRHYKHFADAVSRLCWLLTRGAHRCDVGVLFPGATVQAGTLLDRELPAARRAHRTYLDLVGRMVWYDMHPGVLDRSHRDFDVLDDDTVAAASVNDGALRTRDEAYRAVILPACDVVLPDTARVLAGFAEAGGLLIAVGPEDAVAESLRPHVVRVDSAEDVAGVLEERLGRQIEADGPALHRQVGDRHVLLVPAAAAGSATAQPMLGAGETWHSDVWTRGYDFDPARYRASVPIRLPRGATDVEQWDPQSGRAVPVDVRPVDDGVEVTATFEAPAAVLVWRDAPQDSTPAGTVPAPSATDLFPERIELDGPWESELVPTIDNRYGDFALPAATGPFPVQQWRLAHRRENADEDGWDEVLVGHGTFAWLRGPGDDDDWRPVRYSLTRGIENDPAHNKMLGPKARVPEEFWSVDRVERGQSVELRTHLPVAEERNVWLAIGTAGVTEVWWNGDQLGPDPGGYLRLDAVRARAGDNELRVRVTAERTGPLRGYWALTVDPHAYVRPIWLEPGDAQAVGSTVRAHGRVTVEPGVDLATATLQLGTAGPARLYVNGAEVAVQGAFEPYGSQHRVLPYDVTSYLRVGDNDIDVELTDVGGPLAVVVDGLLTYGDGREESFVTDDSWSLSRDGTPITVRVVREQHYDARFPLLRARPHPLPGAGWLDPDLDSDRALDLLSAPEVGGVLNVVPDAFAGEPRPAEIFRLVVPPGATSARLPLAAPATARLDGQPVAVEGGVVALARPDQEGRVLEITVEPADGRTEGALWNGPIEFDCGPGTLSPGPWSDAGLGSYSGGVRYRRRFRLAESEEAGRVTLDLGAVRGTAEVRLNGVDVGVRLWSPYRLDLTPAIRPGENELEVTVFNTLGPYLDDASPTRYVFPGQRLSGMLGPVRLERGGRDDDR